MQSLWLTWQAAAAMPFVDESLRQLYRDLDAVIAERKPICNQSGRCCKFDTFDHLLYVTGLEIAWFKSHAPSPSEAHPPESNNTALPVLPLTKQDGCPYQINNLCTAHTVRPLGCRIFFCEQGAQGWQQDVYEDFLSQLKTIHTRFDLPYRYMEWRSGLDEAQNEKSI